jgi:hypothetical protein
MDKIKKKTCKHNWKEDEDFASGMIMMVCGSPNDLGEETRAICTKCGEVNYVRMKDLGSITDLLKSSGE